ncbi:MAG: DNA polymerase IV [Acetobacter indonesiensis]|uniref:DNA polymerase IV n=1 Tax=Acetobacter indonesiensis TaxID=104101 RepID=UPI0020A5BE31|nr:DNA polymerase IV [Acetobacter indonesiensis]MCI1437250.1 DNA polymerase IV [Acetobacter indonesiensis]MCI1546334.1 DNA polymerase IV [Acetobacter indonesiensis]MCI1765676.1 DNA polymerase IV [Acetobacter indonesiensis]MCP1231307.1 DNA polymerase IV [Acetobacter indonesiensis]
MSQPVRRIIHIDMDAFYASVEQRDNPALKGHPVAVGRSQERGVVAAASYEARTFGVRSAMPSVVARRKCPHLIFVPPRFDVYRAVSAQIHAIFARYTPLIQPLSLDEAYLDVTDPLLPRPSATAIAQEIRAAIKEETGLTASAGISYNKFLAKLASDYRKPDGQFVIPPGAGEAFVAELPVGTFHGIGPATAARMNALGIHTGADLRQQPLPLLIRHFGKAAPFYHGIARGEDLRPVEVNRPRKSIGKETTFQNDLHHTPELHNALGLLADSVWMACTKRHLSGRTVTLKLRYSDFTQLTRSKSFTDPVQNRGQLEETAVLMLSPLLPLVRGVRLLGITVSSLDAPNAAAQETQLSLLAGL